MEKMILMIKYSYLHFNFSVPFALNEIVLSLSCTLHRKKKVRMKIPWLKNDVGWKRVEK